ncbi:hypothetical protein PHYSODRAFT_247836 [Phytophthora sojae]|uniref:DUF7869 domain-containing protein n=1 Tax=Phytophthora sojae (strain P6497) TaxID=1094619 RepID=G4YY13_PHYSP|nr:hypothetical protein PHYSODRAFT_247836 [Phytophthora sojae]EGZ25716.1 hypothetical protein PHYSODRAFT_247836 [Phytophthora sojae]|eukprot:XP_009521004.1 hypothetical protein PHYSODRAFT_247836 [Phytophthora sojae]
MVIKDHGNKLNKNASQVDVVWLVKWFTSFAEEVGEVVPVRVRMQKKIDGSVQKYYSSDKSRVREPARATMRKLLTLHCPTIRIRSPRSNVCDVCVIYHAGMRGGVAADKTEALGRHTESARLMRREYKCDKTFCSSDHAVIVMDYSQNLTIPSVANTPSQWYFCSLLSVSCFGIYYENDGAHTNYIYDENTSSKGSDQINSMLAHFIETKLVPSGKTKLTVYTDNCSGQNKNNYVIKFLLTLVDMGIFEHVDFKFFVKGHTKNSCDRAFGHIRKHLASAECWTMQHVIDAVDAASANSVTVHVPRGSKLFKSYKPVLTELYKRLDDHIEILPPPPINAEKKKQMYNSIRPYVPDEFQNDPLYAKPSEDEGAAAKTKKQARLAHRAAMAAAAKKNQEGRGMAAQKKRAAPCKKAVANSKKRKSSATPEAEDE